MNVETGNQPQVEHAVPHPRWYHKLSSLLFAIFCFELGLFLLIFPWVEAWGLNYFGYLSPSTYQQASMAGVWRSIWLSPYFRGAISGLGLLNLYISFSEVSRLRR
jgi:hypothetical protein